MGFLKNIFGKKEDKPIKSHDDFWKWFTANEKLFFTAVKSGKNIEKGFFDKLSPKLNELKEGFFFVTGMFDDDTVELILTPDGNINNIAFVEDLVSSAPALLNWKFTALKPPIEDISSFIINMEKYAFSSENLFFYSNDMVDYPDEIDITVVYDNFKEEDKGEIGTGIFIFIDNYIGELNSVTTIDNVKIIGKNKAEKELVPIVKLKPFLIWREKEFLEKYEGIRYNTEDDSYSSYEIELENGMPLLAIMNTSLLKWDSKASHPWILNIEIKYDGDNNNGLPDETTYLNMNDFEDALMEELKDFDGYLNIGRQTGNNSRDIYFACKDFRKPSKVLYRYVNKYADSLNVTYDIYKDKYWRSFNRFNPD